MTPKDWRTVVIDAAALGIRTVQLIGGEPTVHPNWREFTELGLHVEVYSNLFHVAPDWWDLFSREGVTLGTSYYSDAPAEHDEITKRAGSYLRTKTWLRPLIGARAELSPSPGPQLRLLCCLTRRYARTPSR
jgi:MoaA/NifB/PqqE/SkfB family radical SAM enzyme